MRVSVNPIFEMGRPVPAAKRKAPPESRGLLKFLERRIHALGRITKTANVVTMVDGMEQPVVPELVDAELIWVDDQKMRIRGLEVVEGVTYGQTWEVTVV